MSERMIDSMDEDGRALHQVPDAPERSCEEVEAVLFALIDCEECEQLRVSRGRMRLNVSCSSPTRPDASTVLMLLPLNVTCASTCVPVSNRMRLTVLKRGSPRHCTSRSIPSHAEHAA